MHLSVATLRFRLGLCQRTLLVCEEVVGKRGARPCLLTISNVARTSHPAGDFCPRPFRCARPAVTTLWPFGLTPSRRWLSPPPLPVPPVCSSSTPGPYCPEGNLWTEPPRAAGHVSPPPEAPVPPHRSPSRPAFPREKLWRRIREAGKGVDKISFEGLVGVKNVHGR
jgi:hypothetical protein